MDGYTYLAPESSRLPLSTSGVPEGFPLGGEVSISSVKQEMLELDQTKEEKKKKKRRGKKEKNTYVGIPNKNASYCSNVLGWSMTGYLVP